ncbi:MAG: hypothetical protein K1X29_05900 [Bdellovibrionales bacterium]|nr:hypothetical protein [Bdellovibrionales bacterium]
MSRRFYIATLLFFSLFENGYADYCPDDVMNSFLNKQDCIYDLNSEACLRDALFGVSGAVVGGVAGNFGAFVLNSLISSRNAQEALTFQRLIEAINVAKSDLAVARKIFNEIAEAMVDGIDKELISKYERGRKFLALRDLAKIEIAAHNMYGGPGNSYVPYPKVAVAYAEVIERTLAWIQTHTIPNRVVDVRLTPRVLSILNATVGLSQFEPTSLVLLDQLDLLYPEVDKYLKIRIRELQEAQGSANKNLLRVLKSRDDPARSGLRAEWKDYYSRLWDASSQVTQRAAGFDLRVRIAAYAALESLGLNYYPSSGSNISPPIISKVNRGKAVIKGVAAGVALAAAGPLLDVAENIVDKKRLENCKDELKLNDYDLKTLQGKYYLFSKQKAVIVGPKLTSSCKDFMLVDARAVIAQYVAENYRVTDGLCNIISNSSQKLMSLWNDVVEGSTTEGIIVTCERYSDFRSGLFINKDSAPNFTYFSSEGYSIEAPWNTTENWIDYTKAKVFNYSPNRGINYELTERLRTDNSNFGLLFSGETSAIVTQAKRDIASTCNSNNKNSPKSCDFLKSLVRARHYYKMYRMSCSPESNDRKVNSLKQKTKQNLEKENRLKK